MNSRPAVSIIVPTFNRAHYIGECLDSLLGQTVHAHQILVIDDGSADSTREVVSSYGDSVTYLHKPNGGKPSAVNLALGHVTGDLIWLFDDDDVALPNAIEHRLDTFARHPDAGFVYSSHHLGSDDAKRNIVRGRLYRPPEPTCDEFFLEIMRGCFFHLNSCLVRREVYQALGGMDPDLLSSEDYDFQIRMSRISSPAFSSAPSFIFRQHGGVRGAAQIRHSAADRSKVFRRYSQSVGKKLRTTLGLGEYLAPRVDAPVNMAQHRQALLNRIHVMANHGCIEELVCDLSELLTVQAGDRGPSETELLSLAQAFQRGWAYEVSALDWHQFVSSLKRLKGQAGGKSCIRALGRSLMGLAIGHPGTPIERLVKTGRAIRLAMESLA